MKKQNKTNSAFPQGPVFLSEVTNSPLKETPADSRGPLPKGTTADSRGPLPKETTADSRGSLPTGTTADSRGPLPKGTTGVNF